MEKAAGSIAALLAPLAAVLLLQAGDAQAQSPAELQRYQQRMEQLFIRLDQNNNQRLERQEVQGHPYLERHFQRLDQQQRGYLRPQDLTPAGGPNNQRSRQFFEQADRNGDGLLDRREAAAYPWLERQFSGADRNGDGRVDRAELRGLAEQRRRQMQQPQP